MMGPVPPMMTKVSGKWLFEAVGFCSVWFNFVISNQIKGLKGVFPMRNVGQTSHICVGPSQHAHWLTFLFKPLNPQSDWMSNGSTNRRSRKRGLYLVSHQDKSYWGWTVQGWIWHVCICLIQLKLSLLIIGNFKLLTNAKPWPDHWILVYCLCMCPYDSLSISKFWKWNVCLAFIQIDLFKSVSIKSTISRYQFKLFLWRFFIVVKAKHILILWDRIVLTLKILLVHNIIWEIWILLENLLERI